MIPDRAGGPQPWGDKLHSSLMINWLPWSTQMKFEDMALHTELEIRWNVRRRQTNRPSPPAACLLVRFLLSTQALSELHIWTDEIIPHRNIWLLLAAKAINRGTCMTAPSGQAEQQTVEGLSFLQGDFNTLPLTSVAALTLQAFVLGFKLRLEHPR